MNEHRWEPPNIRMPRPGEEIPPDLEMMWRAAGELVKYASENLPVDISHSQLENPWLPIVWLPVRITETMWAIMNLGLMRMYADATALIRVMADHAITFAWLAADESPPSRFNAWVDKSMEGERRRSEHIKQLGGASDAAGPSDWAPSEAPWVDTAAAARVCDSFWHPLLEGAMSPGTLQSFEGFYAGAFRPASACVHPRIHGGINYLRIEGDRIAGLDNLPPVRGLYAQAITLHLVTMYVFTVRFCPDRMPEFRKLWNLITYFQAQYGTAEPCDDVKR